MKQKYGIDVFERALRSVILPDDEVVFAFAGLWSFVSLLDIPVRNSAQTILNTLMRIVTPERTLVMPAYNWSFCTTHYFDAANAPSESGVLTELFRKTPGVRRTQSPIDSHCVIGPRADELLNIRNVTLWGAQSEFGWLEKVNARMVRIGSSEWNLGYLHRIEEEGKVPYRYFKTFTGTWTDGNTTRHVSETMYVRYLEIDIDNTYEPWETEMRKRNLFLTPALPAFKIESALAQDILRVGLELVRNDPYCLVKNGEEVRKWVEANKHSLYFEHTSI